MAIGPDLRTFLLAQFAIANIVGTSAHHNHVPQSREALYIWFARAQILQDRTLDQAQGTPPFQESWDLECVADNLDDLDTLSDAVRGLDCAKGTFGAGTIQLVLVEDQSEDYLPRGVESDEGLHIAPLRLEIFGYAAA
jgi:hypothetical protein